MLIDGNRRREVQQRLNRRPSVSAKPVAHAGPIHDIAHSSAQIGLLCKGPFYRTGALAEGILAGSCRHVPRPRDSLFGYGRETRDRADGPACPIDPAYDVVFRIRDEQVALAIKTDALRFIQAGGRRRAALTEEACRAAAGHGSDGAHRSVDLHAIIQDF